MIVAHGGVQGDVSTERLPADAVPAVFAYSLNRKLRKLYSGEYFRYRQASGGEFDYPSNTPNLTEDVFIVKIYDQKAMHGVDVQDAVQLTENLQPKLKLKAPSYAQDPSRPTEVGSSDVGRKIQALLTIPSRGIEAGKIYEIESVNTVSKRHVFFQSDTGNPLGVVNISHIGSQWVFVEQVSVGVQYEAEFNQAEYINIVESIGSVFSGAVIGAKIALLPNSGLMMLPWATLTIGKSYTIIQLDINNNRIGFIDDAGAFLWIDDETKPFRRQRGVDWQFTSMAGEIGQDFTITAIGDGGDFPRPMISLWGTTDRITVEPSDQATRFTFNNNLGTILNQDGKVTQCISGYDPKQNNHRALTVKTGGAHGHITTTSQTPTFSNISIGREDQRFYKGTFSEATMHLGSLTELGSEQLFQTTRTYYGD